jgi:thiol-disulfide isomerase/thioredoxin
VTKRDRAPKQQPTPGRASHRDDRGATRRHTRRAIAAWVTIGVVLIGGVLVLAVRADERSSKEGVTDATAFDLPALGREGRVRVADYAGAPTVVNFFASWCTQCDAELPGFHAAAAALDGAVNFVFVNANETGNWRPMAERHDLLDFAVARDIGGANGNGLYRSFGGSGGMPMTAFYDAEGQVLDRVFGALPGDALSDALNQLYGVTVEA